MGMAYSPGGVRALQCLRRSTRPWWPQGTNRKACVRALRHRDLGDERSVRRTRGVRGMGLRAVGADWSPADQKKRASLLIQPVYAAPFYWRCFRCSTRRTSRLRRWRRNPELDKVSL